jgi:protein-disulfide isomerase
MIALTLLSLFACKSPQTAASTGEGAAAAATKPSTPPADAPTKPPATPVASSGVAQRARNGSVSPETTVATWDGGSLTYAPVLDDVSMDLIKLESDYLNGRYEAESDAIDKQVNEQILTAEAKKQGKADVNALLKEEVEDKAGAPTDQEIQDLYNANARKLGGKTLDEVRPDIEKAVTQRKQAQRYQDYITGLRDKYKVSVTLPYPDLPRVPVSVDDDPSVGPEDAPVTIIQFAEFQCPYCGKAKETVNEVMKEYKGKVRFVFRDFPLGFHDRAIPAAIAANCAGKQGKYWEVHDSFMSNQRALQETDLARAAQEAGVDMNAWNTCRQDPEIEAEIKKDMADGAAAGVSGTPAFFVNGLFINGAQPFEKFKTVIDRELAAKG